MELYHITHSSLTTGRVGTSSRFNCGQFIVRRTNNNKFCASTYGFGSKKYTLRTIRSEKSIESSPYVSRARKLALYRTLMLIPSSFCTHLPTNTIHVSLNIISRYKVSSTRTSHHPFHTWHVIA